MTSASSITIAGHDAFTGHLVTPDRTPGPGLLVIQEIFGVNDYITSVCDRVAAMGYVALAPDAFWRVAPGATFPHTEAGIGEGIGIVGKLDQQQTVADLVLAMEHLRGLPECDGRVGVMGFCFGGAMTFAVAGAGQPDAAVSYYGSGVGSMLDTVGAGVTAPLLFQYGTQDPYIDAAEIAAVSAWADGRDHVTCRTHASGHAFDNHLNPMFSDPPAAAAAWAQTTAFLAEHLAPDAE